MVSWRGRGDLEQFICIQAVVKPEEVDGSIAWQRLPSFQKLAEMLLKHLGGILKYLPNPRALRHRGSDQRQHSYADQPRPRLTQY